MFVGQLIGARKALKMGVNPYARARRLRVCQGLVSMGIERALLHEDAIATGPKADVYARDRPHGYRQSLFR